MYFSLVNVKPKRLTMRNQTNENQKSPSKKSTLEKVESAAENTELTDENKDNLQDALNDTDFEEDASNVTSGFIDLATYDALEKYLFKSTDETP